LDADLVHEQKSPKALKKVVAAFKAACHMNDETDDETVMMKKQYKILDSGVFNHLIVGSLKNMSEILDNLINRDKSTETEYVLYVIKSLHT
jgi:hypothetical protein